MGHWIQKWTVELKIQKWTDELKSEAFNISMKFWIWKWNASVDCLLCENLSLALLQITNRNYVGSYVQLKKLDLVPKNFNSVPKKSI